MTLKESAKHYLKTWLSIIPVGKDKVPLINWKEYQQRKPTEEEIDKWFEDFPEAQIWAVTGKISWLIVVDVEKWWDVSWLPETAISKTWGGWYHYYYKFNSPYKNKTRIKELTDIRWDWWYVVLPPSETTKWKYSWFKKANPVMFPYWLFKEEKKEVEQQKVETEYEWAWEWGRNDAMTRYLWHLIAKIHPTEWDSIAWLMFKEANKKNSPPLDEHELKSIFDSITWAERNSNKERWYKEKLQKEESSETQTEEDSEVLPFFTSAENDASIWLEKFSTWFPIFDEAFDWWMAEWDVAIIAWATWQGKTEMTLTFTYNFASQWIPVLYFSYEVLVWYLLEKFQKMWATADMPIYTPQKCVTGNIWWIDKKIVESKKKYWVKVVVIDHLWFLMPRMKVSESSNWDAILTQMVRDLKSIAIRERIIIILPVHLRKTEDPSMNDIKGSSGIAQEADEVFMIIREKNRDQTSDNYYTNHSKIILEKNRKTGRSVQWWFTLINGRFVKDDFYKLN